MFAEKPLLAAHAQRHLPPLQVGAQLRIVARGLSPDAQLAGRRRYAGDESLPPLFGIANCCCFNVCGRRVVLLMQRR